MEKKYGKIKAVTTSTGQGQRGPWTRYEFEMEDGLKYSTFDKVLGIGFVVGICVEMAGEQDGKYWKLKTMMEITQATLDKHLVGAVVEKVEGNAYKGAGAAFKSENKGLMSQKECSIVAQCMTKCVFYGKPDASLGQVLDVYHEAVLHFEQNG